VSVLEGFLFAVFGALPTWVEWLWLSTGLAAGAGVGVVLGTAARGSRTVIALLFWATAFVAAIVGLFVQNPPITLGDWVALLEFPAAPFVGVIAATLVALDDRAGRPRYGGAPTS